MPAIRLRSCCGRLKRAARTLDADGRLLGINKDVAFTDVKVMLQTGDIVVFYTDGITEMQNQAGDDVRRRPPRRGGRDESRRRSRDPGRQEFLRRWMTSPEATQPEDDLTIVVMKLIG